MVSNGGQVHRQDGGFFIRRARLILFGDVHEHVFVYLQPDFASAINDQLNVAILRDWYSDISFDKRNEFRVRVGQSKVPFGFENMQSSQNRVPFDRSDPINAAVKDERDIGLFFYYAPDGIRRRFKRLVDDGLKGSGDYGVVGLGLYNGQTANQKELNDTPHAVARVAYPFRIGKQILEPNLGGYTGRYRVKTDDETQGAGEFRDVRAYGALVLYPQPFGLQLEYNVGRGPEYVDGAVRERPLYGGYALATLRMGSVIPTCASRTTAAVASSRRTRSRTGRGRWRRGGGNLQGARVDRRLQRRRAHLAREAVPAGDRAVSPHQCQINY